MPARAGEPVTLLTADLQADTQASLLVCFETPLPRMDRSAPTLALWDPASEELLFKRRLENLSVRRSGREYCATIGRGEIAEDATYALVLVRETDELATQWPPMRAVLTAWPNPSPAARGLLGSLLVAVALGVLVSKPRFTPLQPRGAPRMLAMLAGLAAYALAYALSGLLGGDARGLAARGGLLLGVATALGLRAYRREVPARARLAWMAVPVVALAPMLVSTLLHALRPPQVAPPVMAILEHPSTRLLAATIALLAPVAEELLFRAFVQGALARRFGNAAAVIGATTLFTLFHLSQVGTEAAAWVPIAVLGLGLGVLRARSGSTRPAMIAHLLHNASLTL